MTTLKISCLLAACLAMPTACSKASPSAPMPAPSPVTLAEMTQADIEEFLRRAEDAEKIEDPLARCLAYPDIPGNQWPKGLTQAHCEYNHGRRIGVETVRDHIARGMHAELDALYKADLERHFSKTDFSEVIHGDFNALEFMEDQAELDRITQTWLEKAPQSPYALAARAMYYRKKAGEARGGGWASDTPAENMRRMHELSELAIDHYRRALKIEPRLLPALVGLIALADMDSRDELLQWAISEGNRLDPACRSIRGFQMSSLEPRWGGSEAEMQALADEVEPYVTDRPLLALVTVWPSVDRADMLLRREMNAEAVETLKPILARTTHPKAYQAMANGLLADGQPVHAQLAMVYLLHAARFADPCCAPADSTRGQLLLNSGRTNWAIKYLERAIAKDPADAFAHLKLAEAYVIADRRAEAEPEYLLAMKDAELRQTALHGLSLAMSSEKFREKGRAYSRQFTVEYPDIPVGWLVRADFIPNEGRDSASDLRERIECYERYLEIIKDRPDSDSIREEMRAKLEKMRS